LPVSSHLLLIVLWAGLLVTFLVMRPAPHSALFWSLVGSALLFGGLYMVLSLRESRRTQSATLASLQRVDELVDVRDYRDDGHLPEYLDDAERRRVIEALERMPAGARSLRRAIGMVSPDLLDDDS
jgi:hypothetical protein